jgi:peptide/nickel transport system substrate-binding protein
MMIANDSGGPSVMRSRHALSGLVLCAVAAAPFLAGCGGTASNAGSAYRDPNPLPAEPMVTRAAEVGVYGGRFVIGQTNPPKTFNAIMANETSSSDLTQRLFVTLWDYDNGAQTDVPSLAKSYEMSPDGLTYTFHLRRGAAFSDGHPITSDDVLFCFEVAYDDELHPSIQDLLKTDGKNWQVSAVDSYTVVITIPKPNAMFVPQVGSLRIMPKHVLEPAYRGGTFASSYGVNTAPDSVVTSGPWRVKQYLAGEKTVLARNPWWFGVDAKNQRLPYLDELVFLIVPDQNTAALKFQSGELDGLDNVKPEDYRTFEDGQQAGNYTLYDVGPALSTNFFWFNMNKVREPRPGKSVGRPHVDPVKYGWFTRKEFRQAVSMAVDRDAMIRGPFYGEAVPNWSQMTAGNKVWHNPALSGYAYDPEGAKRKLASLGWRDGDGDGYLEDEKGNTISFTLKTNSDNAVRVALANFIKDDLAKVGIKVTLTPVDFNTLITNFRQDFQYEAALLGLQSGVPPDPGMGMNVYLSSGLTHYWNIKQPRPETPAEARIDALMAANVGTTDMEKRKASWQEIEKILNEESFIIWLPTLKAKIPIKNRFGNLEPTVIPHRIIWNIERIYVKPRGSRA